MHALKCGFREYFRCAGSASPAYQTTDDGLRGFRKVFFFGGEDAKKRRERAVCIGDMSREKRFGRRRAGKVFRVPTWETWEVARKQFGKLRLKKLKRVEKPKHNTKKTNDFVKIKKTR